MVLVESHSCDGFAFASGRNRFVGILNGTFYRF